MVSREGKNGDRGERVVGTVEACTLLQQLRGTGCGRRKLHFQGTSHQNTSLTAPRSQSLPPPRRLLGHIPPVGASACNQQQTHARLHCSLAGAARCLGATRKCFCLCSPARLPMLLGIQFPPPLFPHPHHPQLTSLLYTY